MENYPCWTQSRIVADRNFRKQSFAGTREAAEGLTHILLLVGKVPRVEGVPSYEPPRIWRSAYELHGLLFPNLGKLTLRPSSVGTCAGKSASRKIDDTGTVHSGDKKWP